MAEEMEEPPQEVEDQEVERVERVEEEEVEVICPHCEKSVVPIRGKTPLGGISHRCPKCGKFMKPQVEEEKTEETPAKEEEPGPLPPVEVEMTERIKVLLLEHLPKVYGIPKQYASKRIAAIIDTLSPGVALEPWNLHSHIKNFAPEADDRHLESILTKIYSTLEAEGYMTAPTGYRPRYAGTRRMYRQRQQEMYPPRHTPGGYPSRYLPPGEFGEFEEEDVPPPRKKPMKVVVDGQEITTDFEGYMAWQRYNAEKKKEKTEEDERKAREKRETEKHDLEMQKFQQEIKNLAGEGGKKEDLVPITVGGQTINVPASIAPLYLKGEDPAIKELKAKIETQDQTIKDLKDEEHKKEVDEIKGSLTALHNKFESQPTFEDQLEAFDRVANKRGLTRTGKTTLDVISDLGTKADENAKLLLKRMAHGGEEEFKPEVKRTPEERRQKAEEIEKRLEKKSDVLQAEDDLINAAANLG